MGVCMGPQYNLQSSIKASIKYFSNLRLSFEGLDQADDPLHMPQWVLGTNDLFPLHQLSLFGLLFIDLLL